MATQEADSFSLFRFWQEVYIAAIVVDSVARVALQPAPAPVLELGEIERKIDRARRWAANQACSCQHEDGEPEVICGRCVTVTQLGGALDRMRANKLDPLRVSRLSTRVKQSTPIQLRKLAWSIRAHPKLAAELGHFLCCNNRKIKQFRREDAQR